MLTSVTDRLKAIGGLIVLLNVEHGLLVSLCTKVFAMSVGHYELWCQIRYHAMRTILSLDLIVHRLRQNASQCLDGPSRHLSICSKGL